MWIKTSTDFKLIWAALADFRGDSGFSAYGVLRSVYEQQKCKLFCVRARTYHISWLAPTASTYVVPRRKRKRNVNSDNVGSDRWFNTRLEKTFRTWEFGQSTRPLRPVGAARQDALIVDGRCRCCAAPRSRNR